MTRQLKPAWKTDAGHLGEPAVIGRRGELGVSRL
jgi:hypothetical protein